MVDFATPDGPVAVTLVPGMTAPDSSLMVPRIEASD
jgi:hypothetical protein